MSIRIPQNVDLSLQNCLRDIERALNELKSSKGQQSDSALLALQSDVERLTANAVEPRLPDDRKVFVASGPMHAVGFVPDPGATAGTAKFLREDGTWVSTILADGTTVSGSMVLTSATTVQPVVYLLNQNADANGPALILRKDSASPAINDSLGTIRWRGSDSTPTPDKTFVRIDGIARAVAAGGEQGRLMIYVYNNGAAVVAANFYHDSVHVPLRFDTPALAVRAFDTTATQTVNTGAATVITFDSEDYDTNTFHGTSTSRLVVPTSGDGYYRVTGRVRWSATAAAGWRQLRIEKNSAGTATTANIVGLTTVAAVTTSVVFDQEVTATVYLAAASYVEVFAATSENTTIATLAAAYDSPSFEMYRIGT